MKLVATRITSLHYTHINPAYHCIVVFKIQKAYVNKKAYIAFILNFQVHGTVNGFSQRYCTNAHSTQNSLPTKPNQFDCEERKNKIKRNKKAKNCLIKLLVFSTQSKIFVVEKSQEIFSV